jgi:monofunctional biosynthetic peptidoglycan transglycosylase
MPRPFRPLRWLLRLLTLCLLAALLLTLLLVLPWRWWNPPTTAFMLRDSLQRGQAVAHVWLPAERISPWLAISIIAAEDQKFPDHFGFDFDQLGDALAGEGPPSRGASTMTQQLAKNLYLWPGRSYVRKGLEAYLTLWMEALWPKQRILDLYLNVVEFGPGIYGAGAAAEELLQTRAADLSPDQASLLAAVLPNPRRMSAADPSPYVQSRALDIRRAVEQLGGLSYLARIETAGPPPEE